MSRYFATCARGLESVLAAELRALDAGAVEPGRGGVHFSGEREMLYRANLWLRTAVRVLQPILEAPINTADDLYEEVKTLDWSQYMTADHTLAVDCNVRSSQITHSRYAALKVKDAICDWFLERVGRRPSVDTDEPMVGLNLHIYRDEVVLSLESSGESLHKRGYRPVLTKAPLNEALAAALVLLSDWDPGTPLVDPLCGSGTIPIEAAWIALRRPPGSTRKRFGFQGWMDFDIALWAAMREEARHGVLRKLAAPIHGSDARRDAIDFAHSNARAAGLGSLVRFELKNLAEFQPPPGPAGVVICNPPYGERLGEERELVSLYRQMGNVFGQRCHGWQAFVFTGNAMLAHEIGLKPVRQIPLFNGKIPCQLLHFDLT